MHFAILAQLCRVFRWLAADTVPEFSFNARPEETTLMKFIKTFITLTALLAGMFSASTAQDHGPREAIQKKLGAEYALTKTTDDKTDIVTAGTVLVLQKDKLMMAAASSSAMCVNTYKDGHFSQNASCKASSVLGKFSAFGHGADKAPATRTFVSGEKFWLTKLEVRDAGKDSAVVMEFFTDAINDVRFRSSVTIGFKDGLPSPEEALKLVQEVVKAVPSDDAKQGGDQQQAAPAPAAAAEAAPAAIAPPPPPPDAPAAEPPTVALGQTPDQVVAILGAPLRKAKIGPKEIYSYKDLKVTFLNGKVKDIQ